MPSSPRTQKVLPPGVNAGRRPNAIVVWIGFGFVMLGAFIASQDGAGWRETIFPGQTFAIAQPIPEPVGTLSSGAPVTLTQELSPTPFAGSWAEFLGKTWGDFDGTIHWARWAFGALFVMAGALCVGGNPLRFLLDSALFLTTLFVSAVLLQPLINDAIWRNPSAPWLAASACLAICYGAHALGRMPWPRVGAVIGFVLVALAGVAVAQGYLEYDKIAPRLGAGFSSVVGEWQQEFKWGTVLLLTSIGVVMTRGRMMFFLVALMLGALAYYCIHDGSQKIYEFTEQNWPSIAVRDLRFVPTWRWCLAGELALLGLIFLHLSLGVGALTVVFAAAWLGMSVQVDKHIGREALLVYSVHSQQPTGLPNRPGAIPQRESDPTRLPGGPADLLTGGMGARKPVEDTPQLPPMTPAQKASALQKDGVRIGIVFGWTYLNAIFAGIIAACGLRLLFNDPRDRHWMVIVLWLSFGASLVWLAGVWPQTQNWQSRLSSLVIPKNHIYAVYFVALAATALFSAFALKMDSRRTTWLKAGVWFTLAGTAMTLISLAMAINFGGMPTMPVWKYVAIAGGQSCMMWVLLLHQAGRDRQTTVVHTA